MKRKIKSPQVLRTQIFGVTFGAAIFATSSIVAVLIFTSPIFAGNGNILFGGPNEAASYSVPSYPGMGTTLLAQARGGSDTIPVQSTPYGMIDVTQAQIPGMPTAAGKVGSVGHPATSPHALLMDHLPPDTVVKFVRPLSSENANENSNVVMRAAPNITNNNRLTKWEIVPEGTPGAIPVAVRSETVLRPVTSTQCVFAPVVQTQQKEVRVVNPRTGRVVKTYMKNEDVVSCPIPILHREELTTYEKITVPVATPIPVAQKIIAQKSQAALISPPQLLPSPLISPRRATYSVANSAADQIPVIQTTSYAPENSSPANDEYNFPSVVSAFDSTSSRVTTVVLP